MEVIQKKILLEEGKSHLPGFLPFLSGITDENVGNYKGFVYNIDFSMLSGDTEFSGLTHLGEMSYVTMMNKYYALMNFYKDCTYYRPILKRGEMSWVKAPDFSCEERYIGNLINKDIKKTIFNLGYHISDVKFLRSSEEIKYLSAATDYIVGINEKISTTASGATSGLTHWDNPYEILTFDEYEELGGQLFYDFITRATGKIYVPVEIEGSLVPNHIYLETIKEELEEMNVLKKCKDQRKFNERGGNQYIAFLSMFTDEYIENEKAYFANLFSNEVPKINIPICLTINYDCLGNLEPYCQDWISGKIYYLGDIVYYDSESYICAKSLDSISLEEIGCLKDFNLALELGYWVKLMSDYQEDSAITITYQGRSQLMSLKNKQVAVDDDNNEYQGYFTYNSRGSINEELGPMFSVNKPTNMFTSEDADGNTLYWGNMIYLIEKTDEQYHFKYVIGGLINVVSSQTGTDIEYEYSYDESEYTGVQFDETYNYENVTTSITVNDSSITITYDYIDFDSYKQTVENDNEGIILSNITHTVDDIYRTGFDGKERIIQGYTFRNGKELGLTEKKVWINNVDIDRGSNAAYENFYRLTEVNTLEDLINYQNNYFNLDTD